MVQNKISTLQDFLTKGQESFVREAVWVESLQHNSLLYTGNEVSGVQPCIFESFATACIALRLMSTYVELRIRPIFLARTTHNLGFVVGAIHGGTLPWEIEYNDPPCHVVTLAQVRTWLVIKIRPEENFLQWNMSRPAVGMMSATEYHDMLDAIESPEKWGDYVPKYK